MIPDTLKEDIKTISEIITITSKFSAFGGGVCIFIYLFKIKYLPLDLSIGDALLFIMVAACFGIIYTVYTASLFSLGLVLSPLVRLIFKYIAQLINRKHNIQPIHTLAPLNTSNFLFTPLALSGVYLVFMFGRKNLWTGLVLLLLSIALYIFYSISLSSKNKIQEIKTLENKNISDQNDLQKFKNSQKRSLLLFLFFPLLFSPLLRDVSDKLLNTTMRLAHIRIEKPIIYIKEPYSDLLPKSLIKNDFNNLKDYTSFYTKK